jgi:hypothetical protein
VREVRREKRGAQGINVWPIGMLQLMEEGGATSACSWGQQGLLGACLRGWVRIH